MPSNLFFEKIEQLISVLEKQEFDVPNGIVSGQLYCELFGAYLYKGDLCSARFLWKRIPANIKTNHLELEKMYNVYLTLWNNDIPNFFKAINEEWSTNVAELMFELKGKIQHETINLVALAYNSIFEDCLCNMINQNPDDLNEMCNTLGWTIQDGPYPRLVIPTRPASNKTAVASAEQQLAKLTEFVSFLEN